MSDLKREFFDSAINGDDERLVKIIGNLFVDDKFIDSVDEDDPDRYTSLMYASLWCSGTSSIECVKLLLQAGTDPNIQEADGWTALMFASKDCNDINGSSIECVKLLLEAGADPNIQNSNGYTALMLASLWCSGTSSIDCVKLLLEAGANPYIATNGGDSPMTILKKLPKALKMPITTWSKLYQ